MFAEGNRPIFVFSSSLLFFAFVNLISLVKDDGILDVKRFETEIVHLRQEFQANLEENNRIRMQIKNLENDKTIERIARQHLGLVLPGETVYEFIPSDHLKSFFEQTTSSVQQIDSLN